MNTRLSPIYKYILIIPITLGLFALPLTASASWTDILGSIGIGNSTSQPKSNGIIGDWISGGSNGYYDTNSTVGQSDGAIKLSKRVRRVEYDQDYHENTYLRSGTLVEIWIEVKNDSNQAAEVIVTDELGGNVVYVKNSLRVNGQASGPGLTTGGLRIVVPGKGKSIITYEMYVCGGSSYAIRARAYSAGLGSATDAIVIQDEQSQAYQSGYSYNNNLYSNQVYSCMNQVQSTATSSYNPGATAYSSNNAGNPFGDWTGVNNFNSTPITAPAVTTAGAAGNPFGDWTGVNNFSSASAPTTTTTVTAPGNPFGGWTGVNNSNATNANSNPFGDWVGVNNFNSTTVRTTSTTTSSSNPFGDWTGVSSDSNYDMRGYSSAPTTAYVNSDVANTPQADSSSSAANTRGVSTASPTYNAPTHYVAPTTGVNKTAPLWFALLLTGAFAIYKKRKLIFN